MNLSYTKSAQKSLSRIDKINRHRIKEVIEKLPLGDIKKLVDFSSAYRLRVGNWRILFYMNNDEIQITDVLPRGEAYKK
ncbi:plasmid stabilization system protein [Clostridia bacterium]|nr:plasmid stabilization system protein [Clostridia bacterium]